MSFGGAKGAVDNLDVTYFCEGASYFQSILFCSGKGAYCEAQLFPSHASAVTSDDL